MELRCFGPNGAEQESHIILNGTGVCHLEAWTWEEDLWEWGGAAGVFWNSLSWGKLKKLFVFEESGLPDSGCDDKLEKRCHSEDFYALKWGKIEHSEGRK